MFTTITKVRFWTAVAAFLATVIFLPQQIYAASVAIDLCAKSGTMTMPDGATITVWGYVDCSVNPALAAPGGPTIYANQGDLLTITLHNGLTEQTALLFQGQVMPPDRVGVAPGGVKAYSFPATAAGTYLYEAGLLANAQHQVAMGLYGALIVRPATTDQAYAAATTTYNDEAVVMLSEIDAHLNNSATPATFDLRNYTPQYWLINGQAYPNTLNIPTAAGHKVLLRYVNAGLQHHSMALLGLNQTVIALDGSLLIYAHGMVAETIAPGQTVDVITTVPATAGADSKFALYDGNLLLNNNGGAGFGGLLTFLTTPPGTAGADTVGPTTSAVALNVGTGLLTAAVSDVATGNANVIAAEYFIDTPGATGTGAAMTGPYGTRTVNVQATIPAATLAGLATGSHTIYVRGQDALNNWGALSSVSVSVDHVGPTSSGLLLNPNPSNGSVNVALSATSDDRATGNSNIALAEYTIDGGAAQPMTVNNTTTPIASLTAIIPAATVNALSQGAHIVAVRSQDALGNWGAVAQKNLLVDKNGPTTSAVSAAPNPNNGATGLSPTQPVVRVTAQFDDASVGAAAASPDVAPNNDSLDATAANHIYLPLIATAPLATGENGVDAAAVIPGTSYVKAAEGFIDTVGVTGAGFLFTPSDGLFDTLHESGYADIPLTTISGLSTGNHTIYVHSQDGAGNWGPTITLIFVIDKVAPTVSAVTVTPAATNNTPVAISAAASDVATGNSAIAGGEYFIDNNTGTTGTGTAMTASPAAPASTLNATIPAATLAGLTAGTHTVYVRARDAAGNWSALVSATLRIDRTPPTFSSITLSPNSITAGTATVNLTVNGASDGTGGSGVAGGEYWFGATNITAGTGTAFNSLTTSIATSSLTPGTYTVRVRIRDGAGNWSTGGNGVRTAALTVTGPPPDAIFSDGFEAGNTNAWSSRSTNTTSRLNVTNGAPTMIGTFRLQAQGNSNNYVQFNFGTTANPATGTYDARFYFNPNGNTSTGQDILAAATSTGFGTQLLHVRYRGNTAPAQVQIQVASTANGSWVNITNATHRLEVVWQAGSAGTGSLTLYVDGVSAQTIAHSNTGTVAAVRLGSVTSGGNNTLEYFDAFASKRSVSPLIGP